MVQLSPGDPLLLIPVRFVGSDVLDIFSDQQVNHLSLTTIWELFCHTMKYIPRSETWRCEEQLLLARTGAGGFAFSGDVHPLGFSRI